MAETDITKIQTISSDDIKNRIYTIRGVQVMLDSDLAKIYGYTTKAFNQQIKNNIERFPEDMMFQLTLDEAKECLRSKFFTLNEGNRRGQHFKYSPRVFTEQGIYMLMTVLKGELAIKQSLALVRIFKQMKDYEDFMFLLTEKEVTNLRSKISTSSWGGARYLPHAFTEQGIYMLMTVLKAV